VGPELLQREEVGGRHAERVFEDAVESRQRLAVALSRRPEVGEPSRPGIVEPVVAALPDVVGRVTRNGLPEIARADQVRIDERAPAAQVQGALPPASGLAGRAPAG
jgi:hypothetical protein